VSVAGIGFTTTYNNAGTAKIPASRTRHHLLWVGLWVGKSARQAPASVTAEAAGSSPVVPAILLMVKVCADLSCRVHHSDTPSPEQVAKERTEERKRIEKEKLAITTRHRVLATILQRVSAPLKKADLLAVAHYLIAHSLELLHRVFQVSARASSRDLG
jgi:hypothetical protein